jgi:hypothetical protein
MFSELLAFWRASTISGSAALEPAVAASATTNESQWPCEHTHRKRCEESMREGSLLPHWLSGIKCQLEIRMIS